MTTAGYTLGWLREYVAGLEYAAKRGAIEEYLYDTDAAFNFRVDKRGKFAGAIVELAYSPKVNFDSATGTVYAHEVSVRHNVHAQRMTRHKKQKGFASVLSQGRAAQSLFALGNKKGLVL